MQSHVCRRVGEDGATLRTHSNNQRLKIPRLFFLQALLHSLLALSANMGTLFSFLFFFFMLPFVALAQSTTSCTANSSSLFACFPYIMIGNTSAIGSDCCSPLSTYVHQYPQCVCSLQNQSTGLSGINITRANDLAKLCNIKSNASLSACQAPAPSPTLTKNDGGSIAESRLSFGVMLSTMFTASLLVLQ